MVIVALLLLTVDQDARVNATKSNLPRHVCVFYLKSYYKNKPSHRAIVMIQRSTSCCQSILYPTKGIRPELPNGSTSLSGKGFI
uniref:Chemokine interleukin-8-like domain-containing protein n=1 Tax=Solanum tuberosum TaxID=4113 RepID=M1BUT7_SOLTU